MLRAATYVFRRVWWSSRTVLLARLSWALQLFSLRFGSELAALSLND